MFVSNMPVVLSSLAAMTTNPMVSVGSDIRADVVNALKTPPPAVVQVETHGFPYALNVCRLGLSNMPDTDRKLEIKTYAPLVKVTDNVNLAYAPVERGCLFSGYGMRTRGGGFARLHKGLDLAHWYPVDIYAGGDGVILEAHYRHDYGNMVLIDHGDGVYSRYAHLDFFADDIEVGAQIKAGDVLGDMGTTAARPVGRHLHYEILRGNYNSPYKSFGLTPLNISSLPSAIEGDRFMVLDTVIISVSMSAKT